MVSLPMKPWGRGPDQIHDNVAAIRHAFNNWKAVCIEIDRLRHENSLLRGSLNNADVVKVDRVERVILTVYRSVRSRLLKQSRPRSIPR